MRHNSHMPAKLALMPNTLRDRMLDRLGKRYFLLAIVMQHIGTQVLGAMVVFLVTSFYDSTTSEQLLAIGVGVVFVELAMLFALNSARSLFEPIKAWECNEGRTPEGAQRAWEAAVSFPRRWFTRVSLQVSLIAAVPGSIINVQILDLGWASLPPMLVGTIAAVAYGTLINYGLTEFVLEPVIARIAIDLPPRFQFSRAGFPLYKRLAIALPVLCAMVGTVVAAIVSDGGGGEGIIVGVCVAVGVALFFSTEAGVLVARSFVAPVYTLQQAMRRVDAGDYTVRVPVVTGDELGELTDSFNRMAAGLAERERMREAFGTYLDRDVAQYILDAGNNPGGFEAEVSVVFCDVRDFTTFAETASPPDVVATLNETFEQIVPIVARHGGHVDKFVGDGVMLVFGIPEGFADHADRAYAAACEITAAVNASGPLRISAGINTGRVVAGSIGGGGRLNFSVIGDAVNVAARVEAQTRKTGDDVLITAATRRRLQREPPLVSRGTVPLKGRSATVELFAPGPQAAGADAAATETSVTRR